MTGILCGECQEGKGVSVLLNDCVSCPKAQGLLILGLSKFNNGVFQNMHSLHVWLLISIVIMDAIAFIAIVVADVPFPEWIYPFIFYIQVINVISFLHWVPFGWLNMFDIFLQVVPAVALFFPGNFLTGGKFVSRLHTAYMCQQCMEIIYTLLDFLHCSYISSAVLLASILSMTFVFMRIWAH